MAELPKRVMRQPVTKLLIVRVLGTNLLGSKRIESASRGLRMIFGMSFEEHK